MAGAFPNIGYHISEKELIGVKMWVFYILEPARLLRACKLGSRVRMDSRTGLMNIQKHCQRHNGPEG